MGKQHGFSELEHVVEVTGYCRTALARREEESQGGMPLRLQATATSKPLVLRCSPPGKTFSTKDTADAAPSKIFGATTARHIWHLDKATQRHTG